MSFIGRKNSARSNGVVCRVAHNRSIGTHARDGACVTDARYYFEIARPFCKSRHGSVVETASAYAKNDVAFFVFGKQGIDYPFVERIEILGLVVKAVESLYVGLVFNKVIENGRLSRFYENILCAFDFFCGAHSQVVGMQTHTYYGYHIISPRI